MFPLSLRMKKSKKAFAAERKKPRLMKSGVRLEMKEMITERQSVRAVLLSPDGKILMMKVRVEGPDGEIWITPGEGLKYGESENAALRREIREETDFDLVDIGPRVWKRVDVFRIDGQLFRQSENYYLCRVNDFEPVPILLDEGIERQGFIGFKWWSVEEIRNSPDLFAPRDIHRHLSNLIEQSPHTVVRLGR
ncbi:NUDIX hydrolase [Desulfosarcina variabilis]|uniref:NUDIX hydrolase n=1 Tax=Desulfosarcina variabilis TaxID=2300 RepID=UPI003AFA801C